MTPQNHLLFDPWSSSSTGHQRSDSSAGTTHWRRLRSEKLARQFGRDTDKTQAACRDIRSYLGVRKTTDDGGGDAKRIKTDAKNAAIDDIKPPSIDSTTTTTSSIFTGTTIYINGSTAPQISDHALKRLLIAHGADLSLSLARRSVSHVIVGRPASPSVPHGGGAGAGGGLAARKLQTEIQRSGRQRQVKVVGVEWLAFLSVVLESCLTDDC